MQYKQKYMFMSSLKRCHCIPKCLIVTFIKHKMFYFRNQGGRTTSFLRFDFSNNITEGNGSI